MFTVEIVGGGGEREREGEGERERRLQHRQWLRKGGGADLIWAMLGGGDQEERVIKLPW